MTLRLKLLGGPCLERAGAPLTGRSTQRRRLGLLALLALARAHGMTRDKLIAYLWPERDAEAGRHSLSQTLYAIRQDLGGDLLIAGVDDVRLNSAGVTCDVWEFEDSVTAGEPERAVALYTGPFLDGFYINDAEGFERWAESERSRLARVHEETIERLARVAAEQGALLQAAGWWERRAALDPLDSRVAVALMNALAAGGNRAGALRHAQLHASLLERELGAGPNPAVQALAERLAQESGLPAGHASPTPAERNEEHCRRLGIALGSRYRLERELGSGGMATVYLAEDLQHARRVAVKVLKPEVSDRFGSDRFLREIGIAARLEHPHILPLFDSGRLGSEVDSGFYYVTPYVAGNSLRHRLGREHQLPIEEAVRITCEIAAALAHAHSHGIVHRDIKPENVLLQDGSVLVADFGLARALDAVAGERLTQSGVVVGTPHYMSPEQASASPELDARADIYALGCVLYEMLAGEPPFGGPTAQAILARHAIDQVPPLRTIRPTVPPAVERAVLKALAKVPADRFSTAAQFADALTRPSEVPGLAAPVLSRPARWMRHAAAIALLAGGSIGGWLALRSPGPRVVPSASVVAVLPFVPNIPDTLLSRLGQDLSLAISANLDGIGEVRAVDPRTLLARTTARSGSLSLRQAAALGRQFGAGSVLHGTLGRMGGVVRLDLALHSSDTSATDSGTPLARLSFSGSPDSMASLSDSITRYLLRQIWRRGAAPSPSLDAALRTRSVPALGAFLEGERRLVTNRWKEAADAYRRAVDADSTFWLAQWRRGFVHYWLNGRTDSALTRIYWKHRTELPERERLLIEALETDSLSTRLDLLRRATDQAPDSWIAWLLYGDALIHGGPLLGHSREEARRAFSRAVGANPGLIPGWDHGTWLAIQDGDTLWSGMALETLTKLDAGPALYQEYDEDELRQLRLLDRIRRGDSSAARLLADSIAHDGSSMTPAIPYWYGFFPTQIRLSRGGLVHVADDEPVPFYLGMIACSFAGRGAWDSAMVAMDRYVESGTNPNAPMSAYQMATLGAWVGALDPAEAASRRGAAARVAAEGDRTKNAQLDWLDGMVAVTRGDRSAVAAARLALQALGDSGAANAERSLSAFELALAGRTNEAGRRLAALEWARAERPGKGELDLGALTAVNRLAAAEWVLAAGDTTQAARLLRWHEAYTASLWTTMVMPLAYLRRARIEERQGRLAVAERFYREFLLEYDLPVFRQQHLVREAALALARIRGAISAIAGPT